MEKPSRVTFLAEQPNFCHGSFWSSKNLKHRGKHRGFSLTMRCFGDVFEKTSTSMFLTMFFKTQNIGQTMHLTMLIAHPY